jgi:DNA (cytosine-5)-methyltransferase 1
MTPPATPRRRPLECASSEGEGLSRGEAGLRPRAKRALDSPSPSETNGFQEVDGAPRHLGITPARELIVDSFAGGGGASLGIVLALGRSPDIAINHDAEALAMHAANHPETRHLAHNVWRVDPLAACDGRPVGLLWASPDCKHFSKAKGGKPVARNIRDLAWVVVRWARQVKPRVICLENVEEFRTWGPLAEDNRPCPERKGETFKRWVGELTRLGYRVEHRELRACDYGAPTIRKRLFLVARCDGRKIVWPKPTHGDPKSEAVKSGKLLPWRTAAEIIDWALPCPSIFLDRDEARAVGVKRPLAAATMARIAKGVRRYVLDAAEPFVVTYGQHGGASRAGGEPLHTITASRKDTNAIVTPFFVPRYGERPGQEPRTRAVDEPSPTVVATGNGASLVAAHLSRQFGASVGSSADAPVGTVTAGGGGKTAVVAAHLMTMRNSQKPFNGADEPTHTVTSGGAHLHLVSAFLAQHNTDMVGHAATEPVSTIVQKGCTQAVVEASVAPQGGEKMSAEGRQMRGGADLSVSAGLLSLKGAERRGSGPDAPHPTVTAQGCHSADVRAFLVKYYGEGGTDQSAGEPLHTVPTKARFGLVTIAGEIWQLVDIGMRMLRPRELFRAQGFPDSYRIDAGPDGRALTLSSQIRMCGNSVSPPVAAALVAANYVADQAAAPRRAAAIDDGPLFKEAV